MNATIRWNEYRDQVREIANEAHDKIKTVIAAAREGGRFAADHTTDVGDPDNSSIVHAERAAYQAFRYMGEVADRLTLPMSRDEASAVAIPQ